jgi:uncharacterized membrane protein YccC
LTHARCRKLLPLKKSPTGSPLGPAQYETPSYQIFGTAAGAVAALLLVALFAQTPELFVLALATWIGACTGVATSARNFRAYASVLAGYTAAIIAVSAVSAPLHAFDIAVARFLCIVLGILVEATLTTIFAPGAPMRELREHLGRYVHRN